MWPSYCTLNRVSVLFFLNFDSITRTRQKVLASTVFSFFFQQLKDELQEVVSEMENMDTPDERYVDWEIVSVIIPTAGFIFNHVKYRDDKVEALM